MSKVVKKRAWGKTRQREKINIINREDIEETLQVLAEEARLAKKAVDSASEDKSNSLGQGSSKHFQCPELLSNEDLIKALQKIKVPIPVYADGSPSRERLLYLYKTNVQPRPQRSRQRRRGGGYKEGEVVAMEVDQSNDWSLNGEKSWAALPQRKRKLSDTDKNVPTKKLQLESPLANITLQDSATSTAPPHNPFSFSATTQVNKLSIPSTTRTILSPSSTPKTIVSPSSTPKTIRLKRPAASPATVAGGVKVLNFPRTESAKVALDSNSGIPKKVDNKITWP